MPGPPFRQIAIVGVGLIGGSIGLGLRSRLRGARLVGIDRPGVLRRAMASGAVHETTSTLRRGLSGADLVILALPVDSILKQLPAVARHAPENCVVTDVGSTKVSILAAARRAGLGNRFVIDWDRFYEMLESFNGYDMQDLGGPADNKIRRVVQKMVREGEVG